jgi:hypothetical protein
VTIHELDSGFRAFVAGSNTDERAALASAEGATYTAKRAGREGFAIDRVGRGA